MIRKIKFIILFGAGLLGLLFVVEMGLWIREVGVPRAVSAEFPSFDDSETRVLLIGDSILGRAFETQTIAGRLQKMAKETPLENRKKFIFSEISKPAQSTGAALTALPRRLLDFRPDWVVVVLGKSETSASPAPLHSWLLSLRMAPYLLDIRTDLKKKIDALLEPTANASIHERYFSDAWSNYRNGRFKEAIPIFEKALLEGLPDFEVGIRGLYLCYLVVKDFDRGQMFFMKLSPLSKHSNMLDLFAAALRLQKEINQGNVSEESVASYRRVAMETVSARGSFKARQWLNKKLSSKDDFKMALKNLRPEESTILRESAVENLRSIVQQSLEAGSRVIVLQYPTDHRDSIESSFAQFQLNDQVFILESRDWVLAENSKPTLDLIEEDIDHLTADGSEVVAQSLFKFLRDQ